MKLDRVIAVRNRKTVYRDGDKCVKVFSLDYSKSDVLNEALNQSRIEETGLNIPQIREVTMIDGKWAIISDYIKGKTLSQLMEENQGKKKEYIELLVDLQREVHSKYCPLLNRLRDNINRKIADCELDATTRFDLHTRLEAMPKHTKVCHGEFRPSNILVSNEGTAYILDWSHATQGNASADAARTYLYFRFKGDSEGAREYLSLFCEKTNTDKEYVKKWIPIVAASESVKANEKEREFLLSMVNASDY